MNCQIICPSQNLPYVLKLQKETRDNPFFFSSRLDSSFVIFEDVSCHEIYQHVRCDQRLRCPRQGKSCERLVKSDLTLSGNGRLILNRMNIMSHVLRLREIHTIWNTKTTRPRVPFVSTRGSSVCTTRRPLGVRGVLCVLWLVEEWLNVRVLGLFLRK